MERNATLITVTTPIFSPLKESDAAPELEVQTSDDNISEPAETTSVVEPTPAEETTGDLSKDQLLLINLPECRRSALLEPIFRTSHGEE